MKNKPNAGFTVGLYLRGLTIRDSYARTGLPCSTELIGFCALGNHEQVLPYAKGDDDGTSLLLCLSLGKGSSLRAALQNAISILFVRLQAECFAMTSALNFPIHAVFYPDELPVEETRTQETRHSTTLCCQFYDDEGDPDLYPIEIMPGWFAEVIGTQMQINQEGITFNFWFCAADDVSDA